jgi:ethanolamine utilization protein EutN
LRLAVVIGRVISSDKHEAYAGRTLLLVQRVRPDYSPQGIPTMAVDYVGAGEGDVILLGAAPGLAARVLRYEKAPVQQLVMGIVDSVDLGGLGLDLERLRSEFRVA